MKNNSPVQRNSPLSPKHPLWIRAKESKGRLGKSRKEEEDDEEGGRVSRRWNKESGNGEFAEGDKQSGESG